MPWISRTTYLTESEMENNANIVIAYFRSQGINDYTLSALLANMDAESTINPELQEVAGSGYGLVQWTPPSVLQNHCNTLGLSPYSSGDIQLQVLIPEITGNPVSVNEWDSRQVKINDYLNSGATQDMVGITGDDFLSNNMGWSAQKLTIAFMVCYLRPNQNPNINHYQERMQKANKWLNYLQETPIEADYIARIAPFIRTKFYVTAEFWEDRGSYYHKGLDIATGGNDTLYSMCDGEVIHVGYDANGFGNYIILKQVATGTGFLYGHMDSVSVTQGQAVYQGQPVGVEGQTGHATGIHLHLEMQPLLTRDWIYSGDFQDYINPADYMEIPNQTGISAVYYSTSPHPTPLSGKRGRFPWVLYARKLRNARQR